MYCLENIAKYPTDYRLLMILLLTSHILQRKAQAGFFAHFRWDVTLELSASCLHSNIILTCVSQTVQILHIMIIFTCTLWLWQQTMSCECLSFREIRFICREKNRTASMPFWTKQTYGRLKCTTLSSALILNNNSGSTFYVKESYDIIFTWLLHIIRYPLE